MTETELQKAVLSLAADLGWLAMHSRPARYGTEGRWLTPIAGDKGFPDLVLAGRRHLLFVELKAEDGRLSPEQIAWGDAIGRGGGDWRCWRPFHWHNGLILQALQRGGYDEASRTAESLSTAKEDTT